jgi:hypothetical protein
MLYHGIPYIDIFMSMFGHVEQKYVHDRFGFSAYIIQNNLFGHAINIFY